MPRNTAWVQRKYSMVNCQPKNLCQTYKIQLFEQVDGEEKSYNRIQCIENSNKPIRIEKNVQMNQMPIWAQVNERQEFGYSIQVQSPVSYFNDQQESDFNSYESKMNGKFYSWQQADTNEDWAQYQY